MKQMMRKIIITAICVCMLLGNAATVEAAPAKKVELTNLTFDVDYYYNTYADLQLHIGYDYTALYNHYLKYGLKEGRWGSAEFNCLAYKNSYADLQAAFGNDYIAYCTHYEVYGVKEGRSATGSVVVQEPAAFDGDIIGSYSTEYDPDIDRAINVSVAASRINGVIIEPGDSFSFNQTVLPRTEENGYVIANVIMGKKFVPGIGGGICQVSSTLYAAMLDADLPATERYPHSLEVSYIPTGMDAAIAGNVKDLKFTNIFEESIQIKASANDGVLTVTISKLE